MSENMVLLTAENIRKSYGTRVIFDDISFSIHEGDKIGVIGVNGTGKSTLLKIIAGVDQADSGSIVTMNGMRIGYLSQSPVFVDGTTVLQQVFPVENIVFHIFKIVNRINLTDMKFFFQSNTFVILHSFVTSEVINAENITFIIS